MPEAAPYDFTHLDDASFLKLYKERIEPCFVENEAGRIAAVARFRARAWIGGAAALSLGLALGAWNRDFGVALVVAIMVGALSLVFAYQPIAELGRKLKQDYCGAIARAMSASFDAGGFEPAAFDRMRALSLVPGHDRSKFEDCFRGARNDSSYEIYEAHLERRSTDSKGRTQYSTVFRGQLIRLRFPRAFLGTTIVRRDAGVFNAFGGGDRNGRKLERVGLVDSQFERTFEVWGTDQVEARYLVHPVMMERLLELERGLRGKQLRCAFEGGDVLIAVEGGDLFEPGDLFKPLVDPSRARRIVDEIASVVRVMDQVLTAQAPR